MRWTRPETWHLTLLFLGSVAPERVPELGQLVDGIAQRQAPYRATVDIGGGRTGRGEGVAWLGLSDGAGALIETATLTAARCPADVADGRPPRRTPSAHLTVARRADAAAVEALRRQTLGPLGVSWEIDRILLVRSFLEADGARYATLHEATM